MTPPVEGAVAVALGVEKLAQGARAEFSVVVRTAGRPLYPLIRRGGDTALKDIATVIAAVSARDGAHSLALVDNAWRAVTRLAKTARQLPKAERETVGVQIERMMQGLLAREEGFTRAFTEDIEHRIALQRRALVDEAKIAAEGVLGRSVSAGDGVLARLTGDLEHAAPEVRDLVRKFLAIAGTTEGVRRAAHEAAAAAPEVRRLLQGTVGVAERSRLWGYVSRIRGALGEAYALMCEPVRSALEGERARARDLADLLNKEVGPGHTAEYIKNAEQNLKFNGVEGAEVLVAVVRRGEQKVLYEVARVQVKIARESEAASQSIKDILRSVGQEAGKENLGFAHYTFDPTPGAAAEVFIVKADARVTTNVYLINAVGGKMPKAAVLALEKFGVRVTEIVLDLNVEEFTYLALSFVESAIKSL